MEGAEGRDGAGGASLILMEAECSDSDSEKENDLGVSNADSDEDFIDNAPLNQGNSLALFQTQQKRAEVDKLTKLKRKLQLSPGSSTGGRSPLSGVSINTPTAKRRLLSIFGENEAGTSSASVQVHGESQSSSSGHSGNGSQTSSGSLHLDILKAKNQAAMKMSLFKTLYVVSYADLTRVFKNNKTVNAQWVAAIFGVREDVFAASKELLSGYCTYLQALQRAHERGNIALYLCCFKVSKCRETVDKLFQTLLNVNTEQILLQPPCIRGLSAAMFWYKSTLSPCTYTMGDLPSWIKTQILLTENTADAVKFDFSRMVQWALDNDHTDEASVAYNYAQLADVDRNARAWLNLNNQAKVVKDCVTMVSHYQRAINRSLTISAYIYRQCEKISSTGSWLTIMYFLKHQSIEPIVLVNALKTWLQGIPKKNCLAFIGPSDTGKSLFTNSLIHFLHGKVLNFANSNSHFWLSPLAEARCALIDDATMPCLKYCDTYLRNFFDGYPVNIDRKHKTSLQLKAPPLIITSNVDIPAEDRLSYLRSRVQTFYFRSPCPMQDGKPLFQISDPDWKSFFERLWGRLELSDQEEGEDGSSIGTFTVSARDSNVAY
ncbi:E1 early protein [Bos taurus papillomavirus 32]|nr:E1 early protein [Bos taurus papillomavirus 32]